MMTFDEFFQQVRTALHHLYDYPYLDSHPLALQHWDAQLRGGLGRAQRLSRWLLEAIEALNPPGLSGDESSHARYYAILVSRFVEERPLAEVLRELGYSRAQYFREQQKAITMLASILWEQVQQHSEPPSRTENLLDAEVERVLAQRESLDPAEVVFGVMDVIGQLAAYHGVSLTHELACPTPPVYGNRTLLRQVLLKGLSGLIAHPEIREILIRLRCQAQDVIIEWVCRPGTSIDLPDTTPARRLVEMMGGRWHPLAMTTEELVGGFTLPAGKRKTLLVIEDNAGFIRVFEGYLAGYDYHVVGATTADEALRRAREQHPDAITLDIMMPDQDGWEILQALKSDPLTRSIPVIICSILEDPELALALGAAAYLQKPISQAELLGVLRRLPDLSVSACSGIRS